MRRLHRLRLIPLPCSGAPRTYVPVSGSMPKHSRPRDSGLPGPAGYPRNMKFLPAAVSAGTLVLAAALSGCTPAADVEAAPDAANPDCATVMVALPENLAGADQRETTSQATSAWGSPAQVIVRCGVPVPGPTTDACATVNGVDWVLREEGTMWTATTYGRDPAVEVIFDTEQVASSTVLVELENAVARIEQTRECLATSDVELPG